MKINRALAGKVCLGLVFLTITLCKFSVPVAAARADALARTANINLEQPTRAARDALTAEQGVLPNPTPQGPLNLAAAENGGRVISVTDELVKYPASNLIDGDKLDYGEWWTDEPPQFPQVVVFGLANDQVWTIDRVVLNAWTSEWRYSWIKEFEIYVSESSAELDAMEQVGAFTLEHLGVDQLFSFDPVRARYVALVVRSSYGGEEGVTLNEFEVYAAPQDATVTVNPNNLVAAANGGRIVDFSSEDPNGEWSPENLIDSDAEGPGWSSEENPDAPQFIVFALRGSQPHTVNRVVLNPYSENYEDDWIQDFELRGALDATNPEEMKTLGRFRLAQIAQDQEFTFAPAPLRYLALLPLSNYGGTAYALNEFQVFAAPANAAPPGQAQAAPLPTPGANGGADDNPTWPPEVHGIPAKFDTHVLTNNAATNNIAVDVAATDLLPYVYHLYGNYFDDLVTTTLTNRNMFPVQVRVEAALENYTDTDVQTITLAPGAEMTVTASPPLLPGVLERLREAKPATLHVQIDFLQAGERRLIYEGTAEVTVWAHGDVGLGLPGYHNSFIFTAAMSMPNDPALDTLLREAADYAPGGIIRWGYGDETDSNGMVYHKLKAVYDAIAARGVIYVATGIPFVPQEKEQAGFYLQRLKLPYEVLETRSGLCVELSLLFASAYEKMLLDPVLIRIPGHVYLAVPIAEGSSTYYVLEPTVVGRMSFDEALQVGSREFDEALPELSKDRLDRYFWLNIQDVRQEGITPIPWR
ncbi:MAG: discoidin domain-containing protein [Chloroflexi bacterium]|nr:discoidin domain-containing protein [Chloroflexota bacterium]